MPRRPVRPAALERRLGFRISFVAITFGSWAPDLFTKWFIYGINIAGYEIRADDPAGVFDQLTPEMVGEMRDQRVAFIRKVAWPTLAAGALMTALALVLRRAPVLLSLLAGAVYVVVAGVLMAVDVTTLLQDLVVKAVTLLGLFRVVSCAMAYELGRPEPPARRGYASARGLNGRMLRFAPLAGT